MRTALFSFIFAFGLTAFAMPPIEGNYVCKTSAGVAAGSLIVTIVADTVILRSGDSTALSKPLQCMNESKSSKAGDRSISYKAECTDKLIALNTEVKFASSDVVVSAVSIALTSDKSIQFNTSIEGTMDGKPLRSKIKLSCEK